MKFEIKGRITETESELGVRDLRIHAWDKDRCYDDLLGNASTDDDGQFKIVYTKKAFRELFEACPDIYLSVLAPDRTRLLDTEDKIRWGASTTEAFNLRIDREKLGPWAPTPPKGFPQSEKQLADRERVKATTEPPAGADIEVQRIWFKGGKEVQAVITQVEGKSAFSVRVPFKLEDVKRPSLL